MNRRYHLQGCKNDWAFQQNVERDFSKLRTLLLVAAEAALLSRAFRYVVTSLLLL
jgi:hypothetical protein